MEDSVISVGDVVTAYFERDEEGNRGVCDAAAGCVVVEVARVEPPFVIDTEGRRWDVAMVVKG